MSIKLKRKYKRFEMKHPTNELVQMDTKGPFYLKGLSKHYFIHAIDDCPRRVVSKWCRRRTSEEALSDQRRIELHDIPMKVMHDCSGKESTSNKFKNFLSQQYKGQADTKRLSTRTRQSRSVQQDSDIRISTSRRVNRLKRWSREIQIIC